MSSTSTTPVKLNQLYCLTIPVTSADSVGNRHVRLSNHTLMLQALHTPCTVLLCGVADGMLYSLPLPQLEEAQVRRLGDAG